MNIQGGYYGTALQAAAVKGYDKMVQFLVQSDADVNIQGGYYGTALIAAAAGGYDKIVQFLINVNTDVNVQDGSQRTALIAAAAGGFDKKVQFLIDVNADVNVQGGYWRTALIAAAAGGHEKVVQILVKSNADVNVNVQDGPWGTALIAAAAGGHDKIVQILVQSNADIGVQGVQGKQTGKTIAGDAFYAAVHFSRGKALEQLLKADINDYIHGNGFKQAVKLAVFSGFGSGIRQLLEKWVLTVQQDEDTLLSSAKNLLDADPGVTKFERLSATLIRFMVSGNWIYIRRR